MNRVQLGHGSYQTIISIENLLAAWREFLKGKRNKKDVQEFQYTLLDNIVALHADLKNKTYKHGTYHAFGISDPKPRSIHKASVRDRLLHRAIYRVLCPFFDRKFISDSYSCRKGKGTHRATARFRRFAYLASERHTKTVWVLKCDVRKFFASIDHGVLMGILKTYIADNDVLWLVGNVVESFHSMQQNKGLPLGNLTSQLLVNVYMNEFDQFAKHKLKLQHYIRYADDLVILSQDREWLVSMLVLVGEFLSNKLCLHLHPDKIHIQTIASGADFLGWVLFPSHRVLRTTTRRRMMRKLACSTSEAVRVSYVGLLTHGNTWQLRQQIAQR